MPRPYLDNNGQPMDPVQWIIEHKDDPADYLHRMMNDRMWRLSHIYYITDKAGKKVLFQPNPAQEKLLEDMWYLNVILKARRLGFSTQIDIFILDACLWNKDVQAGIIAHHRDDAAKIFESKVKYPYENLHPELKRLVVARTDRSGEMSFSNGSAIRVSTSFRSGTLQMLHVSEYGKISAKYPDKAIEIKTGAFEAVHRGQMIFVESTAEGREGEFHGLVQAARKLETTKRELDPLDWKFHFFPWWQDAENVADPESVVMTSEFIKYFVDLELRGIKLSKKQKAWYIKKKETLTDNMTREHPSYPDEAFEASVEGAYYGRMLMKMRQEGRICNVPYLPDYPVYTFWDIGVGDPMAVWFYQKVLGQGRLFDYYEDSGEGLAFYAKMLAKKGYVYSTFYFPHDMRQRQLGVTGAKPLKDVASQLGMTPQTIVPRPKDPEELADQIEATRNFIATCYIDEQRCDRGILALENYRKEWDEKLATFKNKPLHNWAGHGADALRTGATGFKEAYDYAPDELEPEEYYDA